MADGEETKNDSTLHSGLSRKRSYQGIRESISGSLKKIAKKPKLDEAVSSKANESIFKYGNYNRYYGYRNENKQEDQRLNVLKKEWFENKSVLDIGSNVGHVSLWIGKNFQPEKIKGVDIDCELVKAAKKNIVHYIDENYVSNLEQSFSNDDILDGNVIETNNPIPDKKSKQDDVSLDSENLPQTEGLSEAVKKSEVKELLPSPDEKSEAKDVLAIADEKCETKEVVPTEEKCEAKVLPSSEEKNDNSEDTNGTDDQKGEEKNECLRRKEIGKQLMERLDQNKNARRENVFPYNVSFILENYVPAGKQVLNYVKEEYDVILCLSVTKWVQLNFGDFGLKLMFQKMYKQLFSGGKLILEPQPYKSYKRRKNITPAIRRNYDSMKLMPDQFIEYLLSNEVGFSKSEQIDVTLHEKQGFQRPIYLLTKE